MRVPCVDRAQERVLGAVEHLTAQWGFLFDADKSAVYAAAPGLVGALNELLGARRASSNSPRALAGEPMTPAGGVPVVPA